MTAPRRIVCVVEGHGDVRALPLLATRVLRELLAITGAHWVIEADAIRHPRSRLVDESHPSPKRPCELGMVGRAIDQALARDAAAVLLVVDADDDCPAAWGRSLPIQAPSRPVPIAGVMASREFESWLLAGHTVHQRAAARAVDPERSPRDAKKALSRLVRGYTENTHQLEVTRTIDVRSAWENSASFDKLVRSIAKLVGTDPPPRPCA